MLALIARLALLLGLRRRCHPENSGRQTDFAVLPALSTHIDRLLRLRLRFALLLRLYVLLLRLVLMLRLMLRLVVMLIGLLLIAALIEPRLLIVVTAILAVRIVTLIVVTAALAIEILLTALEATMLSVLLLLFEARIQDAVIVIGMLEVVFREHAIAGGAGVTSERQILLHELLRVAAHASGAAVEAARATTAASAHGTRTFAPITAALTAFHIVRFVHQLSRFLWK